MKRNLILIGLMVALPLLGFDVKSVFDDNVQIFRESDNPGNAIQGFETIVNAYDLGEIESPEAFSYYIESLEYLCVLYYNRGERETVRTLFEKIVREAPAHQLDRPFISPRIVREFSDFRESIVGYLKIGTEVENPEVSTGTLTLDRDASGRYPVPAGEHTLRVSKVNYQPVTETAMVQPGSTVQLDVQLERTHAAVQLVTEPAGVEVFLDGVRVGETGGSASSQYVSDYDATIQELGLNPSMLSDTLVINGVNPGDHVVELRKDCYKPVRLDLAQLELRDYLFKPVRLERSIGFLIVEAASADQTGDLFVDGRRVGTLPIRDLEVCSGDHQLKVAFPNGTFIKTVTVEEGERRIVRAIPKPTLLFVGIKPIDQNKAIIEDVRRRLLTDLRKIPFYNLEANDSYTNAIDGLMKQDGNVLTSIREDYGQALVVFGVEKRVKLKRYVDIVVLNTELYHAEPYPIDPADPATFQELVRAVGDMPPLTEAYAGVVAVDDPDLGRPVIIKSHVDTVSVGDVILKVNGDEVNDTASFYDILKPGQTILAVQRGGSVQQATVQVELRPVIMRQNLHSLSYNSAYLYFRSGASSSRNPVETASARLNLAMCMLRFRNVEQAFDTLSLIQLPDEPGISAGTVLYLKGLCYQEIESWMNLQTLFRNYEFNEEATVINSRGMRVKDLIDFTFQYLRTQ